MGRYKKLISIVSMSLMVLGMSIIASAQWRDRRGNDDYYGRNNSNLKSTARSLKGNSQRFEDVLDRELDRSRYDGTRREDNLNDLAEKFKNAAEDFDDEYDNNRDFNKSADEARKVLNYGSQLDRALSRSRLTRDSSVVRNSWNAIERDLRVISQAYRISYNGQYGRNNGSYGRNDDTYGNNRGNNRGRNNRGNDNRNGRYGNNNLRSTIVNLKNKSARFEDLLDRERNNRNGRRVSGSLEDLSDRFNNAVKSLENEYDNNRDYNDSYDEVRRVLSLGEQVDREVSRRGVNRNVRNQWNSIEQDLRTIAREFNVSYNGSNGNNSRVNDIFRNFPF